MYKDVLTFDSVNEILFSVISQVKATERCVPVVIFIVL